MSADPKVREAEYDSWEKTMTGKYWFWVFLVLLMLGLVGMIMIVGGISHLDRFLLTTLSIVECGIIFVLLGSIMAYVG